MKKDRQQSMQEPNSIFHETFVIVWNQVSSVGLITANAEQHSQGSFQIFVLDHTIFDNSF